MDPNENLEEQRKIVLDINMGRCEHRDAAERLAELVESLDEWLAAGGFLPERWRPPVDNHKRLAELRAECRAANLARAVTEDD